MIQKHFVLVMAIGVCTVGLKAGEPAFESWKNPKGIPMARLADGCGVYVEKLRIRK